MYHTALCTEISASKYVICTLLDRMQQFGVLYRVKWSGVCNIQHSIQVQQSRVCNIQHGIQSTTIQTMESTAHCTECSDQSIKHIAGHTECSG